MQQQTKGNAAHDQKKAAHIILIERSNLETLRNRNLNSLVSIHHNFPVWSLNDRNWIDWIFIISKIDLRTKLFFWKFKAGVKPRKMWLFLLSMIISPWERNKTQFVRAKMNTSYKYRIISGINAKLLLFLSWFRTTFCSQQRDTSPTLFAQRLIFDCVSIKRYSLQHYSIE